MEGLTIAVAVVGSAMIFILMPVYGLIVYITMLAWYPSYLAISVGTIDFTMRRILILAIFAKLFVQTDLPGRFKFIWLDKLVIIYFVAQILAGATTTQSLMVFLENRAGAVFDMVLPYFAVRMIIQNKQQYLTLLKGILIIAVPLTTIGFYECLTGKNPVGFLQEYGAWGGSSYTPLSRIGLYRAKVTYSHSIMYGLFFAMFGPVCVGIMGSVKKKYKTFYWAGLAFMGVGVFSSVSSGPMLSALLSILFISLYHYRRYWKIVLAASILVCGAVEIISNRHFYDVLGGFTLNPGTAWYRSKLIDVAIFEGGMSGHWLMGHGISMEANLAWGAKLGGGVVDIVNHYILVLYLYGLIGLVPFLTVVVVAIRKLIKAFRVSLLQSDKWLIWCLAGSLFGVLQTLMTVSLFGQPTTFFYITLGFCGVMPNVVKRATEFLPYSAIERKPH